MWGNAGEKLCYFLDIIWLLVIGGFLISPLFFLPFLCVRGLRRNRREKEQSKKQILETIAMMEKKERITRKPGRYRPRNWALKWVAYSKGIAAHRHRYQLGSELPSLPKRDD